MTKERMIFRFCNPKRKIPIITRIAISLNYIYASKINCIEASWKELSRFNGFIISDAKPDNIVNTMFDSI